MQPFLNTLKQLTTHKERNIKRHAIALLSQLQALNPQDEELCTICHTSPRWHIYTICKDCYIK